MKKIIGELQEARDFYLVLEEGEWWQERSQAGRLQPKQRRALPAEQGNFRS
jgi:hypothetical protein